jgi:hypothetical protein
MKNLLKLIIIFWVIIASSLAVVNNTYAEAWSTKVRTTEDVPWGNCSVIKKNKDGSPRLYECTVESSFNSVMKVMNKMIKYGTLIASLAWVLFIVINWIAISASGVDSSAKEAAKWRITQTLLWLILLLLTGTLLNIIAPWIYK